MTKHISKQEIELYRKRLMTSEELFATSFHLAICEICYERFGRSDLLESTYGFIRDGLRSAQDEDQDHIDDERIAAYLDEKLNWADREIAETHFEVCAECSALVDKLRLLRAAKQAEEIVPVPDSQSSRRGLSRFALWPTLLKIGCAAASVALLIWLVTLPLRARLDDLQAQVKQLQQSEKMLNEGAAASQNLETLLDQYRTQSEMLKRDNEASQAAIRQLREELARKQVGAPITAGTASQPIISVTDEGGTVVLDGLGNIAGINSLSDSYRQLIRAALTSGRVKVPPLIGELRGKSGKLMGNGTSSDSFDLQSPIYTAVETDRPTFRWQSLEQATAYTVTILDSRLNNVITSPLLHTTEWRIPLPLKRGGIYFWQVKAIKDDKEIVSPPKSAPNVKFKVLEQTKVDELARAKEKYADSHLTLGILYAQMGLLDEAEREMQALTRLNPKSPLVQSLLSSLKKLRR